jgi:protein CpxP
MTRITFKHMVLSGLMAGLAAAAVAQPAPAASANAPMVQPAEPGARKAMPHHDPAKMQAKMAERQAALKAQLQISPAQEAAWTAYTATMQPPARDGARPDREAMRNLTTPERIKLMRAHQAERQAQMDRRADATLSFYAALTPEQQKVFDTRSGPHGKPGHRGHGPRGHQTTPAKS